MSNIAGVLRDSGQFDRAAELSAEALERSSDAFPPEHWICGLLRVRHAESLLGLGQFEAAYELAVEGYDLIVPSLGADSERAHNAASIAAEILDVWNQTQPDALRAEEARRWHERARQDSDPER